MSWDIACIRNDIILTEECAADLYEIDDDRIAVSDDLKLVFSHEHHEFMDYVGELETQLVLKNHKVCGSIGFGSLQGDNFNTFWGYQFSNGECRKLKGYVKWLMDLEDDE